MNIFTKTTMKMRFLKQKLTVLLAVLFLAMTACDDEGNEITPDEGAESAILYSFRTQSSAGVTYYMNVYSEIPAEPSISEAVELGSGWSHRIYNYGEHPYTWDGDASTLTKWNVSKTDLSLSKGEVISFTSIGVSGDFGEPVFVSETKAYFFALSEGKIIEFNPSEMTITQTMDVTALNIPQGASWFGEWDKYVKGNKVIMPLGWYAGSEWEIPNKAQVAVFDITTNQVTYYEDDRMLANRESLVPDLQDNQTFYLMPAYDNMFSVHYGGHTNYSSPSTILKLNSDGSIDPNFAYDIANAIPGIKVVNFVPMAFGDDVIVLAEDQTYEYPTDPADRWGTSPTTKAYKINMINNEVSPFTALEDYDLWFPLTTIDGTDYFWARTDPDGVQHNFILKQNSLDDYTEVSRFVGGQIRDIQRLW